MALFFQNQTDLVDLTVVYASVCLGIGGLVHCIVKNIKIGGIRIPHTTILIVLGVILGFISLTSETLKTISAFILEIHSFDLVAIVFPSFIFKLAFQMDVHIFLKSFPQILILSILGFFIAGSILGFFMSYSIGSDFIITTAIAFGLLTTATDTKDTTKYLGNFKNLGILLSGEELLTSTLSLFLYDSVAQFQAHPMQISLVSSVLIKITLAIITGLLIGKVFISIVSWDRCDFSTIVTVSLFIAYAMFYGVRIYLGASGILTLTVFGIIICCNKGKITTELETSLIQFWQFLYNIFNFILYIEAGILLVIAGSTHGDGNDIIRVLIIYIMCLISRSIMILILSPILSRIGYGLNMKNGVVLVWGALKGTSTILISVCMYRHPGRKGELPCKMLIYGVGIILLHLFINGTTIKKLVTMLGFTTVSAMKMSNMNSIIGYVMTARDRSINVLKMNKLYADAAWDTVRDATKIVHPYKSSLPQEGEFKEGEEKGFNYSICPDCKKEVPLELTPKQLQEMKTEAYLRVLKAKKVSYWRQFEWGMLSKDAHRTLVGTVNDALEKKTEIMNADSLKNLWKPRGVAAYVRNKLVKLIPKKDLTVPLRSPLKSWQIPLYKVVTSLTWEYSTFLLIIFIIISFALDLSYRSNFDDIEEVMLVTISSVCFLLLIIITFLKMIAVGCYNYMREAWHLVDMITVTFSFFYMFYVYKNYIMQDEKRMTHVILLCLSGSRLIYAIRFFRIYYVIQITIPKLVEILDKKTDVHLAHAYDVGKGFVTGEDEVLKLLPRVVGDPKVLADIKGNLEADRLAVTKEIGILQRNRPTIAITVKTREAMASVLHVMRTTTKDLKDGGLVDDEEYLSLSQAIDERQKYIRKRYLTITPCAPDVLLRQVSWLIDDDETANFLITHSLTVNLNYEEILIRAEDEPQGIYVIVSGMARMSYSPNLKKLERLEKVGALPNIDYPNVMDYRESQEDYIVSGNVVGEIGILTSRTHDASITCESSVQAYFISIDVMKYAIRSQTGNYNSLQQRIWKSVAVRLACIILAAVPSYQSWTQEKIQRYLERSFVPKLNASKTFTLGDVMDAVILIEGRALDVINKDIYFAPSYIPRTVQKLFFTTPPSGTEYQTEPILLIVPAKDIDEQDLMDYLEGNFDDMTGSSVRLYQKLSHFTQRKTEGIKRDNFGADKKDMYRGGIRVIKAGSTGYEKYQEGSEVSGIDVEIARKSDIALEKSEEVPEKKKYERNLSSDWEEEDEDEDFRYEDIAPVDEPPEEEKAPGAYTFSYLHYQPMYETNFEEEDENLTSVESESGPIGTPSATGKPKPEKGKKRLWFRRSGKRKDLTPKVDEELENESPPDDSDKDGSNPPAGTSNLS